MTGDRVLVAGAGHNGLVAAILAAQAGRRVTVLERSDHPGGATVGTAVFSGHDVRLSRYSYLVSLFPDALADRLGITLNLASRAVSSFTPVGSGPAADGLLVERVPGPATASSFRRVTGSDADHAAWQALHGELATLAEVVAPALTGPLRRRAEVRDAVVAAAGARIWTDVAEAPLGEMITRRLADDTVRGVVATDGLIGTHTSLFDPQLLANRCFLYHLIGRGTGEWLVPIGGMGAVSDALIARALQVGVEIRCGTEVVAVSEDAAGVTVTARAAAGGDVEFGGTHLLAAVAPAVVERWLDRRPVRPVGAQMKINMLLDRLPRLASGMDPAVAFAGTTHLQEGFGTLEDAYRQSAAGEIPPVLPGEVYCHSLTDPTIMNGEPGATLTLFGLHTPVALFDADPAGARGRAADAALAALQMHLAEPLEDCLARDADGRPCLDIASPLDLEASVGMPGGNIFHGDLSWPWLSEDESPETPAARYGVEVAGCVRILLAGAGSRRGGGVSGLGGAAAVDAMLEY
jgi:phytoene dehydrogenase-like protein